MASSFHVILPSSVRSPTTEENATNKFRVHLPRPLIFNDGVWMCGLTSIIFTHSWPSIGTLDQQYIDIYLKDGRRVRVNVEKGSHATPETLEASLRHSINAEADRYLRGGRRPKREDEENSSLLRIAQRAVDIEKAQFAYGLLRRANQSKLADTETTHYAWNGKEFVAESRPRLPPGYRWVRRELLWKRDGDEEEWSYPYFEVENVQDARALEDAQKAISGPDFDPANRPPLPSTHRYIVDEDGHYQIETLPPTDAELLRWANIMLEVEREADFMWPANATHHPRIRRERLIDNKWVVDEELVPRPPLPRTHYYVKRTRIDNELGGEFHSFEIEPFPPPVETTTGVVSAIAEFQATHPGSDTEPPDIDVTSMPHSVEYAEPTPSRGVVFTETDQQQEERVADQVAARVQLTHAEDVESATPAGYAAVEDRLDEEEEPPTKIGRPTTKDRTVARSKLSYVEQPPSTEDAGLADLVRNTYFTYLKGIARFQLMTDAERVRFVALSTQLAYSLGFEVHSKIAPGDTAKYQCDLKVGQP